MKKIKPKQQKALNDAMKMVQEMMSLTFNSAKLELFISNSRSKEDEAHVQRIRNLFHFNKGGMS